MLRVSALVLLSATFATSCGRINYDVLAPDTPDGGVPDGTTVSLGPSLTVPGDANIFGAGHAVPPAPGGGSAGSLPPMIALPPGTGRTMSLTSVTGTANLFGTPNGPDGQAFDDGGLGIGYKVTATDGISAYWSAPAGALAAVFVADGEPADPPPPDLNCTDLSYTRLSPVLNQVFVVGDGVDGSGELQSFDVPDGATRLFLGSADSSEGTNLPPGQFQDNTGAFTVSGEVFVPRGG